MQDSGATIVGGFRQWLKQGRAVRKGEHGLMIWVPLLRKSGDSIAGESGESEPDDVRFMPGTVFDISQTAAIGSGATAAESAESAESIYSDQSPVGSTTS
jgi:hypothetical protein